MNTHDAQTQFLSWRWQFLWLMPIAVSLGFSLYLMSSAYGLPIDDAYIYLKYIANLNAGQGYSFNPGEVSFGTTSFLYTVVCAGGSRLLFFVEPLVVCQIVGLLMGAGLLGLAQRLLFEQTGSFAFSLIAGFTLAFCRPIYFTAPSGLETTFYNAVTLFVVWLGWRRPSVSPIWLGFAAGVLFLTRPEGLYFTFGFALMVFAYPFLFKREAFAQGLQQVAKTVALYLFAWTIIVAPYLGFVKWHSDFWLPTTFYGKMLNRSEFLSLNMAERIRQGFWALTDGYRQLIAQDLMPFTLGALCLLTLLSLLRFAFHCGRQRPPLMVFAVRGAWFLYLLLPFVYGAVYKVNPIFGGFFVRYIQFLIIIIHIEGFIALHAFINALALPAFSPKVCRSIFHAAAALLFLFLIYAGWKAAARLPSDHTFYRHHVAVNEEVRRGAAKWINQHTPPQARVFTSNTGLGAVGAYTRRYILDEAGLINPGIYPYLKAYMQGYPHWQKILEYLKAENVNFMTTFPPYFTQAAYFLSTVHAIEHPTFVGTRFERWQRLEISRVRFPERYNLYQDFEALGNVIDRAPKNRTARQAKKVTWRSQPAIQLKANQHALDVGYLLMFPQTPKFTAKIAVDVPPVIANNALTLTFRVFTNYEKQRHDHFVQQYPLSKPGPQIVDTIEVDLASLSNRFGFLLYGVELNQPLDADINVYAITPSLAKSKTEKQDSE